MIASDVLEWLLEPDLVNPGVRYFALRDLLERSEEDLELIQARQAILSTGRVSKILSAQHSDGYWFKPGASYSPRYRGTVWQILFLSELGADPLDERVKRGCEYLIEHNMASNGAFSCNQPPTPDGALHCLNGNLIHALVQLGYGDDPRLQSAIDWQVRSITGEGEIEFFASGTAGPGFACKFNQGLPCGWGAVKALKALSAIPWEKRTPAMQRAIQAGAEFLLSRDPSLADYPNSGRVSPAWHKFGFPLSYWSDVLENVAILVDLGFGSHPGLANAIQFILAKQDAQGRWKLENSLNSKMWVDIEKLGKLSKWITLRAWRVLKRAGHWKSQPGTSRESERGRDSAHQE